MMQTETKVTNKIVIILHIVTNSHGRHLIDIKGLGYRVNCWGTSFHSALNAQHVVIAIHFVQDFPKKCLDNQID